MTMERNEKNSQTGMLKAILGGHQEQAHKPSLRAEMISDHGAPTYTPAAWIANRMGRGGLNYPVAEKRADNAATKIRANRKAGTTRH